MPYWFDGNNLIGMSAAAARADKHSRSAFLSALSGWRRSGGGLFLVWFDGDDPADMTPPPGVAVRYSAPESADAAICRRLREIERPGEVTIVTNDRELSYRCHNAGANTFDWRRFTMKMQSRSAAPPRTARTAAINNRRTESGKARKINQTSGDGSVAIDSVAIDVDDWLRFFGIDETQ